MRTTKKLVVKADPGKLATTKQKDVACNSKHGCFGKVDVSAKTGNILDGKKDTGIKPETI